jgi:ketosteroid isomerase-like protein
MNASEPQSFAARWIAAWNRRDFQAVLDHYVDALVFVSPIAATTTGNARIEGKAALAAYWSAALAKVASLRFTLDRAIWDDAQQTLVVVYVAELDARRMRAVEVMRFDGDGHAVSGEAMYGAAS